MDIGNLVRTLPLWALSAAAGFLVGAAAGVTAVAIVKKHTRLLIKDLHKAVESGSFPKEMYSDRFLLSRSSRIETFARKNTSEIIPLTGLDTLWVESYKHKPSVKLMDKILEFIPEKGMFICFLGVMKKPGLADHFFTSIGFEAGNLRKLPLSGSGESFDSLEAKKFFSERLDEIREMAGDPEWPVRYFSIKILLTENDERSIRAVKEAFGDSHPLIRRTVVEGAATFSSEELYPVLLEKMINDPSSEVRKSSYRRISKDFLSTHKINYKDLDDVQLLHALAFLDHEREKDVDTALMFLKSDNLEIRFPSALFLQKHGYLKKLLMGVDFKDTGTMERNIDLLKKASEVKVDGFLSDDITSPASVFASMSILSSVGSREYIGRIAEKVFNSGMGDTNREVWKAVVDCISARGDENAADVLMREFKRRRYDESLSSYILERIPERMEHRVAVYLFEALTDPYFKSRESLENAFIKLPADRVIADLFTILEGGRKYPHSVRVSALKILAGFELPYCLQPLIEQLPTLPVDEARTFSSLLSVYNGEIFNSRIVRVLNQEDAKVRAAVIASLPGTGVKEFLKPIKEALHDSDPDVRIASIWALADYGEGKVLGQAVEMLRDPVERVRVAAALAVGTYAAADKLDLFMDVIKNPDEVQEVKQAAIKGLSASRQRKSIDLLVQTIDENEELREEAVSALSEKRSKKDLKAIIENIKDASPALRQHIMISLKRMGSFGEESIASLLEEDIVSLKDQINEILEESGFVEHQIRLLSHRDPKVRKNAAGFLSRLGTEAAFRGIVLAARDPEEDVRVEVTRALEKLNTDAGKEILEKLENDPDKRVRRFTHWALERIKSKAIED